jgi:hypothetical protein
MIQILIFYQSRIPGSKRHRRIPDPDLQSWRYLSLFAPALKKFGPFVRTRKFVVFDYLHPENKREVKEKAPFVGSREQDEGHLRSTYIALCVCESADLLTDFAALCFTDFIDWRYITHGWYFRPRL